MEFSRQEYWNGLKFPSPGHLPNSGIKPTLPVVPALQADSLPLSYWESPKVSTRLVNLEKIITLAVSSFTRMVKIETVIHWIQKRMKNEEDELVKNAPLPLRVWNRRIGALLASDQGTGVVFKDKSKFTRQEAEDRVGKFVILRKKNRPEKRKINKAVSRGLLMCLRYVLKKFSGSINPLCTVLKDT